MARSPHSPTDDFNAGVEARADGLPLENNPYPPLTRPHDEWAAGWRATFDLDEEDDPASNRMHKEDDIERGR